MTLSPALLQRKAELNVVIENHLKDFVLVASALAEYRRDRLWEGDFNSWEEFCRKKFEVCRSYGYELANAAEVIGNLSGIPDTPLPTSVSQARVLASLPPQDQAVAMRAATTINEGKATAASVSRAAAAVKAGSTALNPGSEVTVLDEDSPHYGQRVKIAETEGVVVQCWVEGHDTPLPFLSNEITGDRPSQEPHNWASKTKSSPLETSDAKLQIAEIRIGLLERRLGEAIALLEDRNIDSPTEVLANWIKEAREIL